MQKKSKKEKPTLTARSKRQRKATYYRLSAADIPTIIEGLKAFSPVYMIADKIGCGYSTLQQFIRNNPELKAIQTDETKRATAFAFGKLMENVNAGHPASIMFTLERLDPKRFGNRQIVENVGDLPAINIGLFDRKEEVDPIDPATKGDDARSILESAIETAERITAEEEAQ